MKRFVFNRDSTEGRFRLHKIVGWGFVSQGASSATSFGLSLLAGWLLGPSGLGLVFLGFSCYLAAVGLQRSVITQPLVATSSALDKEQADADTRAALTSVLIWSLAATLILAAVGLVLRTGVGHGLLLFVPWLIPALLQDYWRTILFRDHRAKAGAFTDLSWLITMAISAPVAWALKTDWAIVGCWGVGSLAGVVIGFRQSRYRPDHLLEALGWWRTKGAPLGRWLGAENVVYILTSQALVFLLVPVVGIEAIGGLRAVQVIYGLFSVLFQAMELFALPELSRRLVANPRSARSLAARLGLLAAGLTFAYVAVGSIENGRLLTTIFGSDFAGFTDLIAPVGARQVLLASMIGVYLLLLAEKRGKVLLGTSTVDSAGCLCFGLLLATRYGVVGAAWGMTLAAGLRAIALLVASRRAPSRIENEQSPDDLRIGGNPASSALLEQEEAWDLGPEGN